MKIENISVGEFIEAKIDIPCNDSMGFDVQKGALYEVTDIDKDDKTLGVKIFVNGTSLWYKHADFRKPKSDKKPLGMDCFSNLHTDVRYAAVDADGRAYGFGIKPYLRGDEWAVPFEVDMPLPIFIGKCFDTSNWKDSLVERIQISGSELCKAMLARGDKYVMCLVSDYSDENAKQERRLVKVATKYSAVDGFVTDLANWDHAVPVDKNGNILTSGDVGL